MVQRRPLLSRRLLAPFERLGLGLERMFQPSTAAPISGSRPWVPEIQVLDRRREVVIRLTSQEIDPKKIRIQLSGRVLTLSAATREDRPDHHGYRAFKRSIVLPRNIDWRHISAKASGRLLIIRIRKEAEAPRKGPGVPPRLVRDIMTRDVRSVTPETTVAEAAALLRLHDIGSVPVCRERKVVGILTDRDIALRVTAQTLNPTEARVGDVMTPAPVTCREEDPLVDAEQLMSDAQVRRLPVVDPQGTMVGYLALAKIARFEDDLRSGHVLRGVSEPGRPSVRSS